MRKFFQEFGKFINRGNVIELAIGIIIGASFQAIVKSLANDIIMPLISSLIGFDVKNACIVLIPAVIENEEVIKEAVTLDYGNFIQCVLDFLIISFSIFTTVKVINSLRNRYTRRKIIYLKKLKKNHPELFDEEEEPGAVLYEKMKNKYPKYFTDEIEKKKPEPTEKDILLEINENIKRLAGEKE